MPAKKSDMVDSTRTAPRKGERSSPSGIPIPAVMRPINMAYGWVACAHIPAAMCIAGGMDGWARSRMIFAMCSNVQMMLTS